ncbi:unnamed protein product [Phytophthora fragariaefolia]|uniref:Unnamed protein product n=1 Tax=Phytophthora fragariaefolia TaxID=1490495 RepID=A0A9W6XK04_9STRA|nr:unnamed protein product [Phytophthora fragariaefolia]
MFKDASSSLSLEKECFPHALINESNFRSLWPLEYLDSYESKDTLIDNATKIGAIVDGRLNCGMYATHYCNRDVDVLKVCFEAFRGVVMEEFDLNIYRFLSVSSLSLAYQDNEGCFDDCYEMNTVLLGFLRQGTVGGRVMARANGNELPGYGRGKGTRFKDSIPSDADYYVARVSFEAIDIKRHFPLLSFYETGSRNFTNDIIGRTMIVGKQALEDIVRFQGASYTVIESIYWNDGFNDQITKTIIKMFNARLKYKAEGNRLLEVLKLLMNNSYGKLPMKPIVKKKVFVSGGEKKIDEYTRKNVHRMISRTPISDNLALFEEHKAVNQPFRPAHLGIQILDSSKHIMNRVMCLAEDIDARIRYQDTDSIHIDYDSVQRPADAYRDLYSSELIGKQMGQFHVDFDIARSEGFIGADKLYRKARSIDKNMTKKNVSEWYKRQQSIQPFSSRTKRFPQFKIASNNPNEWQLDLAFWEKQPFLISVNINIRIGFAKLLNNKRAETVLKAIEDFVGKSDVSVIFSDNGSEFINTFVESFFDERSISRGNAIAGDHTVLGKIDRFIRTIKSKLTKMKQII